MAAVASDIASAAYTPVTPIKFGKINASGINRIALRNRAMKIEIGPAQCNEHILTGTLQAENGHATQENGHCPTYSFYQSFITGESRGNRRREENHEKHQYQIEGKHGYQHNTEAIFHTLLVTMPEVITYNRNESLRKSGQRYTGKLHRTLQNRQCADVDISKFLQTAIEDKPNQTFRTCHNEGGYS